LWDAALEFFIPVLRVASPDRLDMTPCDTYAKWHESHYAAVLEMNVQMTKYLPDTEYHIRRTVTK